MRRAADADAVRAFVAELGRSATGAATLYLVGGATAVMEGWRSTTLDVDMVLEPELDELLRQIPTLKERLHINVEFASPLDFLPELPGWRERSPFVSQEGALTVRHLDPYSQVLAKLERGIDHDLSDVAAMISRGLVDPATLLDLFSSIEPQLYRFPTVDGKVLREAVMAVMRNDDMKGVQP